MGLAFCTAACSKISVQRAGKCGLPVPHAADWSVAAVSPVLQHLGFACVPDLTFFTAG